jgi:eukaryotic-like serine/threonine-protein kinase
MRRSADSQIEPHRLVLIDFGAVKEITQSALLNPKVMSLAIGTMGFMPQEQLRQKPCLASDVYAVGMIGLQYLTGIAAHELAEDANGEIIWRSGTSYSGNPYECFVTPEFGLVMEKMVKCQPGQRYVHASEALAALRALPVPKASIATPRQPSIPIAAPVQHSVRPVVVAPVAPVIQSASAQPALPEQQKFSFEVATVQWQMVAGRQPGGLFGLGQGAARKPELIVQKELKQAEVIYEAVGPGVRLEMVSIPEGSFRMGSPQREEGRQASESPQHLVTVPSFYMGKYPVTQNQYLAIKGQNPSCFQRGDLPVENVSWLDAVDFCLLLSQKTGRSYRLPSEAEWEYACRAGTTTPFHFGETMTAELANFDGSQSYGNLPKGRYLQKTSPIGTYKFANAFGLLDIHGNVREWCEDSLHENYQGAPIDGSAWVDRQDNQSRLLRGGSWSDKPADCRSARRNWRSGVSKYNYVGFRVVMS